MTIVSVKFTLIPCQLLPSIPINVYFCPYFKLGQGYVCPIGIKKCRKMVEQLKDNSVSLKRIFIESELPTELTPLRELAQNLWWSWNKRPLSFLKVLILRIG